MEGCHVEPFTKCKHASCIGDALRVHIAKAMTRGFRLKPEQNVMAKRYERNIITRENDINFKGYFTLFKQ